MNNNLAGVFIVGAGPGDNELITLKGLRCLEKADVIVYDYLASKHLLEHCKPGAELIYAGKKAGDHAFLQEEINKILVEKALTGKMVVRLKGGDPFVFGRGGEECESLAENGIPFEVIPGITSGIAGPAYAGIPVTQRGLASSVAFITGHEDPAKKESSINWEYLAKAVDTVVFYMGLLNIEFITEKLRQFGKSSETPVAVIQWAATPLQRTITATLATISKTVNEQAIKPPAIIVVGSVVNLREKLNWYEKKPLFGIKILNTRSRNQASELTSLLMDKGAAVTEFPTIKINPVDENGELAALIKERKQYDWIIFTSPNAVTTYFDLILKIHRDIRSIGNSKIACIGPGTAKVVETYHITPELTAKVSVAEGLIAELEELGPWKGVKVLLPRAGKARDILPQTLKDWGASITVAKAYDTIKPEGEGVEIVTEILNSHYDLITFSSSSTFENFIDLLGEDDFTKLKNSLKAASIGPITTACMKKFGITPLVEAKIYTIPGLVNRIEEYFTNDRHF